MTDPRPKHKPNEKHTLDEVLKSLKDLVGGEVLAKSPAPPPPPPKPAPVPPSASMQDIISSLETLLSDGLDPDGKSAHAALQHFLAEPEPAPAPPNPVEAPVAKMIPAPKIDFSADELARDVLAAFDDIQNESTPADTVIEIGATPAPEPEPLEEISFEMPATDTAESDHDPFSSEVGAWADNLSFDAHDEPVPAPVMGIPTPARPVREEAPPLELTVVEPTAATPDVVQQELFLAFGASPTSKQETKAAAEEPEFSEPTFEEETPTLEELAEAEDVTAAPAPAATFEEEITAAPLPGAATSEDDLTAELERYAESAGTKTANETMSMDFLRNAESMLEQTLEDITLEQLAPSTLDESAGLSVVEDVVSADPAPETIELATTDEPTEEISLETAPDTETLEVVATDVPEEVAPEPETPMASAITIEFTPSTPAGKAPAAETPEAIDAAEPMNIDALGAALEDTGDSSDTILEWAEPPKIASELDETASQRYGESIELEVDLSSTPPLSTSDVDIGELGSEMESVTATPGTEAKFELSLAEGPLTPPGATDAAEETKPEPAAKPKAAASVKATKAPSALDAIPVLQDVAIAPPPQGALPIPPSPDSIRETAVRVIAKLNIELRKAGDKPLAAKTVNRLQQLLHEALAKKKEEKQ